LKNIADGLKDDFQGKSADRDSYAPLIVQIKMDSPTAASAGAAPAPVSPNYVSSGSVPPAQTSALPKADNVTFDAQVFPAWQYFQSLNITMKSSAAWTGTLDLFDRGDVVPGQTGTFLERLIVIAGGPSSHRFSLRWNWDQGPTSLRTAPEFVARVTKVEPEFTAEGVGLKLSLVSALVPVAVLKQEDFDKVKFPNARMVKAMRASVIFADICDV